MEKTAELVNLGFCGKCKKLIQSKNPVLACVDCGQPVTPVEYIRLTDLNAKLIHADKLIAFDGVLAGESAPKAAPVRWRISCRKCGKIIEIDFGQEDPELFLAFIQSLASPTLGPTAGLVRQIIAEKEPEVYHDVCGGGADGGGRHEWKAEPIEYADFKLINVKPYLRFEETTPGNLFERPLTAVVLSTNLDTQTFTAIGRIVPHTTKRTLTPVIEHVIPRMEAAKRPPPEEIEMARGFFYNRSLREWLNDIEDKFCPQIAERAAAKLVALLTSASPIFIRIGPAVRLATIRSLFYGDARTGKGTLIRWVRDGLGIMQHVIGETARRTGLGFTVDTENRMILWGVLPQADGRLALIEGLHGFPSDQLLQLREALYQGYLDVHMQVSGRRLCRARILADANSPRPLGSEAFWCLAIPKARCFKDTVDITRWDLIVPFDEKEVDKDAIMRKQDRPDDPEFVRAYKTVTRLAWSLKSDEIELAAEAYRELNDKAAQMIDEYSFPLIPLVHPGYRENLLKLSAAFAVVALSLEDGKLIITADHVRLAAELYEYLFEKWELGAAKERYVEPGLTESDWLVIKNALQEEDALVKIIETLALKQLDGHSLAAETGYEYSYVRKLVARLKELGLVDRVHGSYGLTRRGVEAFKRLPQLRAEGEGV